MHPTGLQYTFTAWVRGVMKKKKKKRGWEEVGKIDRSIDATGRKKV